MGRQHTMYMSDETWRLLESLRRMDDSMSSTIRRCIEICSDNVEHFDMLKKKEEEIKKLKDLIVEFGGWDE